MTRFLPRTIIPLYLFCTSSLERSAGLLRGCFTGFWLGVLSRDLLQQIDQQYYDSTANYHEGSYNRRGLWYWELEMLKRYFADRRSLLVAAVGGGREALALHKLGYRVDSFECNPTLVGIANRLLAEDGYEGRVQLAQRDTCPPGSTVYDGLIIGWGGYMLIQGRARRVRFLQSLRARVLTGGPILLSFFTRPGDPGSFRVTLFVANFLRRLRRVEPVELGDSLGPDYAHYFTRSEIDSELREAGFELVYYSTQGYGHAIGRALPPVGE